MATREGDPPTATDLDDDKEGIRPLVSIRDSSGSDLDSGPNVRTRAGLSGGIEKMRNTIKWLSIAGKWKVWLQKYGQVGTRSVFDDAERPTVVFESAEY